jgi:hypothetical protein
MVRLPRPSEKLGHSESKTNETISWETSRGNVRENPLCRPKAVTGGPALNAFDAPRLQLRSVTREFRPQPATKCRKNPPPYLPVPRLAFADFGGSALETSSRDRGNAGREDAKRNK